MKEVRALSFSKERMELFDKLVVPEEDGRVTAAKQLAQCCLDDQTDHDEEVKGKVSAGKVIKKEEEVCALAAYSCKRLIRGMSSGRGSARQGFGLALCEILKSVSKVETKTVLDLMDKTLVIEGAGKPKGGEIRETLLGRVFVYASLLKAGRLSTMKLKALAATSLLEISKKKDYLSEISFGVLMELLKTVSEKDFSILCNMAPKIREALEVELDSCQIEAFQLALWIWKAFGKQKGALKGEESFGFLYKDFDVKEIFREEFLRGLRPSLMMATSSHPRLHTVWYDLVGLIVPSFKKGTEASPEASIDDGTSNELQGFWSTIVDDGLLQSSLERKYLAMELLKRLSPLLSASDLQVILSEPMMICLKQNLKKEENYLHTSAKKCVRYLYSLMKRDSLSLESKSLLTISLKQFSSWVKGADVAFESTNESATNKAQFRILKDMFYSSFVGMEEGEEEGYDAHLLKRQKEILNQISTVCKNPNIEEDEAEEALKFFVHHAFFEFSPKTCHKMLDFPEEKREDIARNIRALPLSLNQYCFDCLVNVLASLFQRPKFSEAYMSLIEKILKLNADLSTSKQANYTRQYTQTNLDTLGVLKDARKKIQAQLKKKGDSQQRAKLNSLFVLVNHIFLLQLGELEVDFSSHANDIVAILEQMLEAGGKRKRRKLNDESAVQWNDVLLDLMLSLLSLPNQLVRKSVDSVFSSFLSDVTESGIKNLVEILQQTISEDDEDEDEDEEMDSEEESEEESDEEEEEEEEGDEGIGEGLEFPASGMKQSGKEMMEDMDVDGDEDEDSDMDDEAMFKLDSIIAAQFQMRRQMNKKRRLEELLHFKFRVLRLIETYLRAGSLDGTLTLLGEVLTSIVEGGTGIESNVLSRLSGIMSGMSQKISGEVEGDKAEAVFGLLDKSVNFVAHVGPKKRGLCPAVEVIALYALKVLSLNGCKLEEVAQLYEKALERFFVHQKKCILKKDFFIKSFQGYPSLSEKLADKLKDHAENARNQFLKAEAEAMLKGKVSKKSKKRRKRKGNKQS